VGDLESRSNVVLRPNFDFSLNLHISFKWWHAFALILEIRVDLSVKHKLSGESHETEAFISRCTAEYLRQSPDSASTAHVPKASSLQLLHLVQTGTLPILQTNISPVCNSTKYYSTLSRLAELICPIPMYSFSCKPLSTEFHRIYRQSS